MVKFVRMDFRLSAGPKFVHLFGGVTNVVKFFSDPKKNKPFVVNDHANYKFSELGKMPETQLVMLAPRKTWLRLGEYVANYEAMQLAGRFGASPGTYEWEWITEPEAIRWWRRASDGSESLFGMAVAVYRKEMVELYGLVEVDENSPHWPEVIPEEAANAMPGQAKLVARQNGQPEERILRDLYRDYFRSKAMLTMDESGQPALRRGTVREVERFRDVLRSLIERSDHAKLPSDMR